MPSERAEKCWPWSHQWAKWQLVDFFVRQMIGGIVIQPEGMKVTRQQRECLRCGKVQVERV